MLSRTHGPGGDAHDARQGDGQRVRAPRAADRGHRARADQGQDQRRRRQLQRARRRVSDVDWERLAARVVGSLGLELNPYTTQIEPHDYMAELFDAIARTNTILIDLDRDVWGYVSLGYFARRCAKARSAPSTMPHKVNPIDFENSEGNLGLANSMLRTWPRSCRSRASSAILTDSTVLRNMGVALGYALLGWSSLRQGLAKLTGRCRAHGGGPRRQLGSARRADPDRDAPLRSSP
jgi:hypothetical protein